MDNLRSGFLYKCEYIKRKGIADLQFLFFFLCKNNKKYTIFSEKSTM